MITCALTKEPPIKIARENSILSTRHILAFNREGEIDVFLFEDTQSFLKKRALPKYEYIALTDWTNANILFHIAGQLYLTPGESVTNDNEIIGHLRNALSNNIRNKTQVVIEICHAWNKVAQFCSNTYETFKPSNSKTILKYQGAYELTLHDYLTSFISTNYDMIQSWKDWQYLQIVELINSTFEGRAFSKNPYLQKNSLITLGEACVNDIPSFKKIYESIKKQIEQNRDKWFTDVIGIVGFEIEDLLNTQENQFNIEEVNKVLTDILDFNIEELSENIKISSFIPETISLIKSPLTHSIFLKLDEKQKPSATEIRHLIEYIIAKNISPIFHYKIDSITSFFDILRLANSNAEKDKSQLLKLLLDENHFFTPIQLNALINKSKDTNIQEVIRSLLIDKNKENLSRIDFNLDILMLNENYCFTIGLSENEFSNHSFGTTGLFNDLKGLETQIKLSVHDTLFYPYIQFEISQLPADLIKNYNTSHSQCLIDAMLKNDILVDVKAPLWLFSNEQRAQLNEHIKPRKKEKEKQANAEKVKKQKVAFEKDSRARFNFWSKLSCVLIFSFTVGALLYPSVLSILLVIKALLYATLMTVPFKTLCSFLFEKRMDYLKKAPDTYPKTKLKTIYNSDEIKALQMGANAITWLNYAKTFVQLPAYTHYKAFLGGYSFAMHHDDLKMKKIKKLKPL